jgi:uncharacterized protein YraI/predicted small lipoprotein YifL
MKEKLQRFTVLALVLSLAAVQAFGSVYLPAYAQEIDETGVLSDMGEGDNRVLTSNWIVLAPGEQVTYSFVYDGDEQPVTVWMSAIPTGAAQFEIWTDDRLADRSEDAETEPLGRGTATADDTGITNWVGGSPEAETYYVVVTATGDTSVRYLLNVSSPALAADQPGAIAAEPAAPGLQPTADPNVAVVTTDTLNVREGPATTFAVITTVANGTELTVMGRDEANNWLLVQLADGTQGWVTRSLTNYTNLDAPVVAADVLAAATPQPGATTSVTSTITSTTNITGGIGGLVAAITGTVALEGDWIVLPEGEVDWYTVQYRGGALPFTLWLDMEPFGDAAFTVVNEETAAAIMAGTAPADFDFIGRGTLNPVEPGYLFWRAAFDEADTYYVMVQNTGTDDVFYSLHALGAGVGRTIAEAE